MKVVIVILNYKTWEMTLELVKKIRKEKKFNQVDIIVVDNNSPNESFKRLKQYKDQTNSFILLKSSTNSGYAAGNNIGLKYAFANEYNYAWILNNDIEITDSLTLDKMLSVFSKDKNIAVVSPDIVFPDGYVANRDIVRPTIFHMTVGAYVYKKIGRQSNVNEEWTYSYRPQGCCMVVDLVKINEVEYMDEFTFLYCEEPILAERLLKKGYKCACCLTTSVVHNHSYTVKNSLSKMRFIKSNIKSFDYLLKKYRGFNLIQRIYCDMFYILKLIMTKQI